MGRVESSNNDGDRGKIPVNYRNSDYFNSSHFIHKYYLSHEDKGKLFPVDIDAIERSVGGDDDIDFRRGIIPENLQGCTIFYRDIGLEKQVAGDLVRRALLASSQYWQDCNVELTPEEVRAALHLNEWLRGYEKTLLAKQLLIEKELKDGLRGKDPFLVDYEIELKLDFYLREDDPFYDNDDANQHDWDSHSALMCRLKYISAYTSKSNVDTPDYRGLGDDQDHNYIRDSKHVNPVYRAKHCSLFHQLADHCDVPFKHLIRIGMVWAEFEVLYQNMVDIDLTGKEIVARQDDTWTGKLEK